MFKGMFEIRKVEVYYLVERRDNISRGDGSQELSWGWGQGSNCRHWRRKTKTISSYIVLLFRLAAKLRPFSKENFVCGLFCYGFPMEAGFAHALTTLCMLL